MTRVPWHLALKRRLVRWLLADVPLPGQKFGRNTITMAPGGVDLIRWSATQAPTAAGDLGMNATTGRPAAFVDSNSKSLATSHEIRRYARAATTSNIATLAGGAPNTVDGVSLAANDLVFVGAQTSMQTSGLYQVDTLGTGSNGSWSRVPDMDHASDFIAGTEVYVQEGTTQGRTVWRLLTTGTIVVDTTVLEWVNGGLYVRSDELGTDWIATKASPQNNVGTAGTTSSIVNVRDYRTLSIFVYWTDKLSSPTKAIVRVEWVEEAATEDDFMDQGTEAIAAGVATLSEYQAEFDITGAASGWLPVISLPVIAPKVRMSIETDVGTIDCHSRYWRGA